MHVRESARSSAVRSVAAPWVVSTSSTGDSSNRRSVSRICSGGTPLALAQSAGNSTPRPRSMSVSRRRALGGGANTDAPNCSTSFRASRFVPWARQHDHRPAVATRPSTGLGERSGRTAATFCRRQSRTTTRRGPQSSVAASRVHSGGSPPTTTALSATPVRRHPQRPALEWLPSLAALVRSSAWIQERSVRKLAQLVSCIGASG